MTTFQQAWTVLASELTTHPWEYTDPDGTTLTVIPEGLVQGPGDGGIVLRITADHHEAAEITVTTTDMPHVIASIAADAEVAHRLPLATLTVTPQGPGAGVRLAIREFDGAAVQINLPADIRRHLSPALTRASDVAQGWEM